MKHLSVSAAAIISAALLSGCQSDPQELLGYSANQLCSRHFISNEPIEFITQNVIPEALAGLPDRPEISVDTRLQTVSVSAQVDGTVMNRTSVFRAGLGCTLLYDLTPEQLHAQAQDVNLPAITPSTPLKHAIRQDVSLDGFFAHNTGNYAHSDNTFAVAVMYQGKLVAERYDEHHDGATRMLSWSMAKTLTGLLTGILVQQGKLTLDQDIVAGSHSMTIANLMHMSSGVKWSETADIHGYQDLAPMWYHTSDSVQYVTQLPKEYEPGSRFEYSTGTTQLLSGALKTASGGDLQSLLSLYHDGLFKPLGINNAIAEYDEAGNLRGGARMFLTVHDWLKIGQLFIEQGNWQGQQIVPRSWVANVMMSPGVAEHYGGQLWLNDMGWLMPRLPKDTVSLRGHRGQYVVIIPSKQLVVARFGAYGSVVNKHIGLANRRVFQSVVDLIEQLEK
ncbi:serine hydrolase domain-containing protein [Pseudoalteromonas ardens]|uniref:Beta-lactamase-related domain-containing protein n=1 Tax=Pseudoalteromonas rubra TaxID=43658 RepID=A0A0L0EUK6_9GAMM|nr:serine hydrolase [Pseudoalteromonas sp. R96]KNC68096.1 hypothetical protein AC626_06895 [Pseudoalteromonas rubra]MDK1311343.1 serine hydrolase [Pseudoalteromonas sp. R96]